MKSLKKYVALFASALALSMGVTACQDDVDAPEIKHPEAKNKPNTTILELKSMYWDDATNYIDTIGTREDGSHIIIHGYVVSSDEAGNVFKSLVIQDETAALAISINSYNLYLKYRRGQEIVIDATGMYIGKYNGLQQLGMPEWYENGNAWEASFMAPEFFERHVELNCLPSLANCDTIVVNSFSELEANPAGLQKWQSQLVRFNNVEFTNGGKETFSTYHSSGVNQTITDVDGQSLPVRTSGYSNFWNNTLPTGRGDVVAICSYYGSTGWQLLLNDYEGCMNFGNPTVEPGSTVDDPMTVPQAIAYEQAGRTKTGWITGYIVGAVAPEVTSVTSNADIEWVKDPVLSNTLVIGAKPDTKDIKDALIIELPAGSTLRTYGNLADNPTNYGSQIWVKGVTAKYMDSYGITGNSGASDTWKIEGVTVPTAGFPNGNGTEASPYNCAQILAMNPSSTTEAVESGVWVKGYIVGWADMSSTYYINAETARFSVPATMATNIIVGPTADCTDISKCIGIQLPSGAVRSAVNLMDNPGNLGKVVSLKGDVMKYSGVAGIRNTSAYVLDGGSTPDPGPNPSGETVTSIDQNFDASTAIPAGWTQMQIAGTKTWYIASFNGNNYASMTGYKGTAPFDSWLMTPGIDLSKAESKVLTFDTQVNGYSSTTTVFECYVLNDPDPSKAIVKTKLNATMATAPATGYSDWKSSGNLDLSSFSGTVYVAWRYYATTDANYATWCVDNVKFNAGGSTPDPGPDPTPDPTGDYKGDFNSFNEGVAKASPYATYTNATGWVADNAIVLGGGDTDANPIFTFIGKTGTLAPTLNGKASTPGRLTSPLLTGGIKTLTFNYGFAFAETKCSFTVKVLDASGNVVKSDTVNLTTITQKSAYSYSLDVNYTGDFKIEIVNDCIGASTSNKERVSIWNLTWS